MDNHSTTELDSTIKHGAFTYSILLLTAGTIGNILLLITIICKNMRKPNTNTDQTLSTTASSNNVLKSVKNDGGNGGASRKPVPRPRATRLEKISVADQLLLTLTCADLACLWILVLRYTVFVGTDSDIRVTSGFVCKLHSFLSMATSNLSIAVLTIFSIHRAISIQWPLAPYTWLTRKRLNISLVFASLGIISKHLVILFTFDTIPIDETGSRKKCDVLPDYVGVVKVYYYFEFITHVVIGYALLTAANIWLAITLTLRRNRPGCRATTLAASRMVDEDGKPMASNGSGRTIAYVLLAFSIIQVITSLPFFILIEGSQLFELNLIPRSANMLTYLITSLSTFTNNGINFYLLLCISSRFRQDVHQVYHTLSLLLCRKE